eukprot:Skav230604  [mRNA]  locus=scaffold168:143922:145454:- [translate_table: standard]
MGGEEGSEAEAHGKKKPNLDHTIEAGLNTLADLLGGIWDGRSGHVGISCDQSAEATRYHEFMTAQADHGEAGCPSLEQPSLYRASARSRNFGHLHFVDQAFEVLEI